MTGPSKSPPVPALPAATIILLRDGAEGLEVLMMERHMTMGFAAGAMVFPGGKVDDTDSHPDLISRCRDGADCGDQLFAFRMGAIREMFEEAGILLAEDAGGAPVSDEARRRITEDDRAALLAGESSLAEIAVREDLWFHPGRLIHFSHWITPLVVPKRFDTHFFVAVAPPEQDEILEGDESVHMDWHTPRALLKAMDEDRISMMFPTRLNLEVLAGYPSVEEAVGRSEAREVVTVMPDPVVVDGQVYMDIPEEAGYARSRYPIKDIPEAARTSPPPPGNRPKNN